MVIIMTIYNCCNPYLIFSIKLNSLELGSSLIHFHITHITSYGVWHIMVTWNVPIDFHVCALLRSNCSINQLPNFIWNLRSKRAIFKLWL